MDKSMSTRGSRGKEDQDRSEKVRRLVNLSLLQATQEIENNISMNNASSKVNSGVEKIGSSRQPSKNVPRPGSAWSSSNISESTVQNTDSNLQDVPLPEPLPAGINELLDADYEASMRALQSEVSEIKRKAKSTHSAQRAAQMIGLSQLQQQQQLNDLDISFDGESNFSQKRNKLMHLKSQNLSTLEEMVSPRTSPNKSQANQTNLNESFTEFLPFVRSPTDRRGAPPRGGYVDKSNLPRLNVKDGSQNTQSLMKGEILLPGIVEQVRMGGGQTKIRKKLNFFFRNVREIVNSQERHAENSAVAQTGGAAAEQEMMSKTRQLFQQKQKLRTISNKVKNTISCAEDQASKEERLQIERQRNLVLKEQIGIICEQQTEWDGIVSGHLQHHVIREQKNNDPSKPLQLFTENLDKRIHNLYLDERLKKQEAQQKLKIEKKRNDDLQVLKQKQIGYLSSEHEKYKKNIDMITQTSRSNSPLLNNNTNNNNNNNMIGNMEGNTAGISGQVNHGTERNTIANTPLDFLKEDEAWFKYIKSRSPTANLDLSPSTTPREEIARLYARFEQRSPPQAQFVSATQPNQVNQSMQMRKEHSQLAEFTDAKILPAKLASQGNTVAGRGGVAGMHIQIQPLVDLSQRLPLIDNKFKTNVIGSTSNVSFTNGVSGIKSPTNSEQGSKNNRPFYYHARGKSTHNDLSPRSNASHVQQAVAVTAGAAAAAAAATGTKSQRATSFKISSQAFM